METTSVYKNSHKYIEASNVPKERNESNIPHSEHRIVSWVESIVACECLDDYKDSDVECDNDLIKNEKLNSMDFTTVITELDIGSIRPTGLPTP